MGKSPEEIKAEESAALKKAEDEKEMKDQAAIFKACKAYWIAQKYLFAGRVDGDEVILVTNGGKKVRYSGKKVEPLDKIAVTGINPALAKRKVIAGKAKK